MRSQPNSLIRYFFLTAILASGLLMAEEDAPKKNTWQKIEVDSSHIIKKFSDPKARLSAADGFSNSFYRTSTNEVMIRTGIDIPSLKISPGFYTNCTVSYSSTTKTVELVEYSKWGGGSYGPGKIPEDFEKNVFPVPRHTYDGICYDLNTESIYMHLGASGRMNGNPKNPIDDISKAALLDDYKSLWRFDLKANIWEKIPGNIRQFWPSGYTVGDYETHLTKLPNTNKLLFIGPNARYAANFDTTTKIWEKVPLKNKSNTPLYGARSTWDTKRNLWIIRNGNSLSSYDPSTSTFQDIPVPYQETDWKDLDEKQLKKFKTLKSICYHSKYDAYVITGFTGNQTKFYYPEKGVWEDVKAGDFPLVSGYLNYDEKTNTVILNYHLNIFELSYEK